MIGRMVWAPFQFCTGSRSTSSIMKRLLAGSYYIVGFVTDTQHHDLLENWSVH
jgi:hypothetical protein